MADATQTLDELIQSIADYLADDDEKRSKASDIAKALHKNAATQPIAQILVGRGVSRTAGQNQVKLAELERKVVDLTEERDELQKDLDGLKAEAPDWKKRLDDQDAKHKQKMTEVQNQLEEERKARRNDKLAVHRQRFAAKLQPGVLVDPDYAEVLAAKYNDNFRLNTDGNLEVIEAGGNAPYDPGDGQDAVDLLVSDALRLCPPKWKIVGDARPGAGVVGESTGALRPKTLEQVKEAQRATGIYAM